MAATGSAVLDEPLVTPDRAALGFLRAAVAARLTSAQPEALREASAAVLDWPALSCAAEAHRLTPLVTRAVSALPAGVVPTAVLQEMRDASFRIAGESLAAIDALGRLTAALVADGVPSLAWKGPALAAVAWSDPGTRSFADLDVVVRPADRHRARAVARSLGWRSRHAMSERQEEAIFGGLAAWELERESAPRLLELHWEFSAKRYAGRLPVEEVLARAGSLRLGGVELRVPAAADTLLLLAQHATKHGWSTLEDVAVFAAVAQADPAALPTAMSRASAVGGGRALLLGCALAAEGFGLPLPDGLVRASRADSALPGLVAQVRARWDARETAWRAPLSWDYDWTVGGAARLRLLARALFDPTLQEWRAVRLPDPLVPLYRVVRPARLALVALGLGRSPIR
ncbi:MAG: nucleotidyltransferase family protein [Gemmatimonadetes bacterium]|nr:nucleotidyltransferase family protein [Gemmatimonadota bacterium]